MSPSMLVCADRHESFRDSDLFAAVAVLEHLLEDGAFDAGLASTLAAWRTELGQSGSGTIDLQLDAIAADPQRRTHLADALGWASERVGEVWRSGIPDSILNRFDAFQVRFSRYPVEEMRRVFDRLRRLLAGDAG